jgi:hypothetical protein
VPVGTKAKIDIINIISTILVVEERVFVVVVVVFKVSLLLAVQDKMPPPFRLPARNQTMVNSLNGNTIAVYTLPAFKTSLKVWKLLP